MTTARLTRRTKQVCHRGTTHAPRPEGRALSAGASDESRRRSGRSWTTRVFSKFGFPPKPVREHPKSRTPTGRRFFPRRKLFLAFFFYSDHAENRLPLPRRHRSQHANRTTVFTIVFIVFIFARKPPVFVRFDWRTVGALPEQRMGGGGGWGELKNNLIVTPYFLPAESGVSFFFFFIDLYERRYRGNSRGN